MAPKINNAPARYEGAHSQLGALIRKEAVAHLWIATEIAMTDPDLALQLPDDPIRLFSVEAGIWQMLATGWARPLADWSGMMFWHPHKAVFEPWSRELNLVLCAIASQMREVVETYTGDASAEVPEAGGSYTGKRAVVFDASDRKGRVH
jgi:hypothetical protein